MLVFPFTFRFLTEYQLSTSIVNQISLTSYMGNFLMLIFVMGIVFELPLLAWLLSKMGLVTKSFFRQYRKHAVVILLVLPAGLMLLDGLICRTTYHWLNAPNAAKE